MNIAFATRALAAAKLALTAHAPTLMVTGGVISMGAAVVTASKKTLELEEILAPAVQALDTVEQAVGHTGYIGGEFTQKDAQKARTKIYARASIDLTKHYAIPGVLFIAGTGLVFGGHRIMMKRNAALAVAFTTIKNAFEKYRERATEAMGPEFDRTMLHGWKKKEVLNEETGKVETISELDWDSVGDEPYARVFQQGESDMWRPDFQVNKDFLEIQRVYAQKRLNHQGYLYLSDVYQALGIQESPLSRLVGWKIERLPDGTKNVPTVDFGLDSPHIDDWKYSREQAIYLDFNCQGLIIGGVVQKIMEKA